MIGRPAECRRIHWIPFSLCLLAACAVNPVTRQSEIMLISEAQEAQIGAEAAKQIQQEFGHYQGLPGLNAYVSEVGRKLAAHSRRKNLTYRFQVLDTPVINAFALPGGYVYVTRGILARMSSEDELAAVIGHEMTHVDARHSASQLSKQALAGFGLTALSILSPDVAQKAGGLVDASLQLAFLGYSRDDEREADEGGITYMEAAGYNPRGAAKMFHMFLALEEKEPSSMERFLLSHPPTQERLEYAEARIAKLAATHPKQAAKDLRREAFLRKIEGLDLGQSRGDKVIAGGVLTLKTPRAAVDAPDAYTPNLSPPEGEALFVRDVKLSGGASTRYTLGVEVIPTRGLGRQAFIQDYLKKVEVPHQVRSSDTLPTKGAGTMDLRALDLTVEGGTLRAMMGFAFREGTAFVLYGYTRDADFPAAKEEFRSFLASLRYPSAQEIQSVKSPKLRLVTARTGDTWTALARREYGKEGPAPRLALYNGIFNPDKQPEAGMLLKIPEKQFLKGE